MTKRIKNRTLRSDRKRTHAVRWEGTAADFFPSDVAVSAQMVGLMVRLDELRLLFTRHQALSAKKKSTEDDTIELFMTVRQLSVTIDDGLVQIDKMLGVPAFKAALTRNGERWDAWKSAIGRAHRARDRLKTVRTDISAHIVPERVAETLRGHGKSVSGAIEFGATKGRYRFPIAHAVLAAVINDAEDIADGPIASDPSVKGHEAARHIVSVSEAHYALVEVFHVAMLVYAELNPWHSRISGTKLS